MKMKQLIKYIPVFLVMLLLASCMPPQEQKEVTPSIKHNYIILLDLSDRLIVQDNQPERDKELIKYLARAMVDHPEQIEISEITSKQVTILELKVAKADIGKIIGKRGGNVRAIRTILGAASAKVKKRTILEIIE